MDFFGKFRRPKSELQNTTGEIDSRLFPGGRDEMLFNAKTVAELGNGKIGIEAAAHLCGSVKRSLFSAVAKFDGRKNLGPNAKQLAGKVQEETGGKLNSAEAAAVVLYLFVDCFFSVVPSVSGPETAAAVFYQFFDKDDPGPGTLLTLQKRFEVLFGSDSAGFDADEFPSGLGEFGFDATNPIPVRGAGSSSIYLGGLRTKDGRGVTFNQVRSLNVPNIAGTVDEFEICQDGRALCKLCLCNDNRRTSRRPPKGFILIPKD